MGRQRLHRTLPLSDLYDIMIKDSLEQIESNKTISLTAETCRHVVLSY